MNAPLRQLITLARLSALGALVGVMCGFGSALFLWMLAQATAYREGHEVIVYTLPLAGLAIGWLYERYGESVRGGSALILDRLREGGETIPLRMAPMVLIGTVLTHLFGGSAGREGTAVQLGASLADALARALKVDALTRHQLLVAGVAGGFGSVFGTPIAGLVFALEFGRVGRQSYVALVPALWAALIGDMVSHALGAVHTHYPCPAPLALSPLLLGKWVLFGAAMALATIAFISLTHGLAHQLKARVSRLPWRMALGGAAVVLLWKLMGTSDYLGLGLPMIVRAFEDPNLPIYAFAAKLLFTALTLSAGYLGGEVTPLFFVGAALGSVMARALDIPIAMGAGVGLAAVFAASANAPMALSVMAVELLGVSVLPHVAIVCVIAYALSGLRGIYMHQEVDHDKAGKPLGRATLLLHHRPASPSPAAPHRDELRPPTDEGEVRSS